MDNLSKAMKELHRAMRVLVLVLVFMLASVMARMFDSPVERLCVWGMGVTTFIFIAIVIYRRPLSRFCTWVWPFVLKRTAIKTIREEREAAKTEERERAVFMRYDELFHNLPAYEFSRHSEVEVLGAALISPHGHPLVIKKFPQSRTMITDDQIRITI